MSNIFKGIADFYEESIKKSNDAGLAEVYKQATDIVFNALIAELKNYRNFDITIEDIEYLDGYFIFGRGTNSVVHFHIKETPSWKYGIWWSPIARKDSTEENPTYEVDRLHCNIFTQYEEEIDKFKPSASMIATEFDVYLDGGISTDFAWNFAQDIKFIHDEPHLAFYREIHYSDFNKEYVSRAKAKSYFERYFKQKKLKEETTTLNNRELLKTIYTILKEEFDSDNCFIHDRGNYWSPRYEIIMKNPWEDVEDGCYGIFDLMEEAYATETRKLWDKTIQDCEKRIKKIGSYWYSSSCCHDSLVILTEDKFNKAFIESEKVNLKTLLEDAKND